MTLKITIGNGTESNSHYVGRPGKGRHSHLGNPFKPTSKTPEAYSEAVNKYREYLWKHLNNPHPQDLKISLELLSIVKKAKSSEGVSLFCPGFCTHQGLPCHAEVVKRCCEWLVSNMKEEV